MPLKISQIAIRFDRQIDAEMCREFFAINKNLLTNYYPILTDVSELPELLKRYYDDKNSALYQTETSLRQKRTTIINFADIIAREFKSDWQTTDKITIMPSVCSVAPHWIDSKTFLAPAIFPHDAQLRICAHEMTHFLYFDILNRESEHPINTERPSQDWLLSEIVAPFITNLPEIQNLVHAPDAFFSPTGSRLKQKTVVQIHELFQRRRNLITFRDDAMKLLQKG